LIQHLQKGGVEQDAQLRVDEDLKRGATLALLKPMTALRMIAPT